MAPGSPLNGICISRVHFSPTFTGCRASIAGIPPNISWRSLVGSLSWTTSIAPSGDTRSQTCLDWSARRRRSSSEACDDGLICTESVIVCINVPLDVHCSAMAREKTSIDVVIELVESRPRSWVMPVISTDCDRCIRSVSPMWGRICSRTAWE